MPIPIKRYPAMKPVAAALIVVVVVLSFGSPASAPEGGSPPAWQQMDVSKDWRFKPDPEKVGSAEGWAAPDFDDREWAHVDAGRPWEDQGFPNYDGDAWYRRKISVPAGWRGMPVYLWLAWIDDEADVYVDGVLLGHFGDRASNQSAHRDYFPIDIASAAGARGEVVVAVRVVDWAGTGGLTSLPAAIATSGTALFPDDAYVKYLYRRNPELAWPYLLALNEGALKPEGGAWTMLSSEGSTTKALLGLDSSIMPSQEGIAVTPWVYDQGTARLYAPGPPGSGDAEAHFSLPGGYLPLPTARWEANGWTITSTLFADRLPLARLTHNEDDATPPSASGEADSAKEDEISFYAVTVTNGGATTRDVTLFLAIRPYGVAARLSKIYSLAQRGPAVLANGAVAMVADRPPDGFGATASDNGDIASFAWGGELPAAAAASDARGLTSGALAYRLRLERGASATLTFKLPAVPSGDQAAIPRLKALDLEAQRAEVLRYWREALGSIQLSLPDERYSDVYYASLAYLYMARNDDLVLPGPMAHRRFWYRDAAYLSLALLQAGRGDVVKPLLAQVAAGQLPSGEFPPILEPDGKPDAQGKREWDAQGEGIFALVSYFRWTKDAAWLEQVYPTIRQAAQFLRELRAGEQRPELAGTPAYGILPPGESAEDLGPAEWHHYWDDFWAIAGLREAAYAAQALGKEDDVRWMKEEEADLRAALLASIRSVQEAKGIDYVPNGPEDTVTPAMARGTTPALWPVPSFDPRDSLLRRSFEVYFGRWITPYGGAYRHEANNYWPYAGLQLAHTYLLLDMPEKVQSILDWTLADETFPNLHAWAESVLPQSGRFAGGDMPHAWFAAEYTLLLRDMLVREDGERLVLGSYLPRPWLADGQRVAVANLPTLFGAAGYTLESHAGEGYWALSITPGANPPGGYLWKVPAGLKVEGVEVDGQEWSEYDAKGVRLPATARTVRLRGQWSEQ